MSKPAAIYQQHEENREFTSKLDLYKDKNKNNRNLIIRQLFLGGAPGSLSAVNAAVKII